MTEILIWHNQQEGDFTIADFTFENGGTLEELNLHYITLGTQGFDSNENSTMPCCCSTIRPAQAEPG